MTGSTPNPPHEEEVEETTTSPSASSYGTPVKLILASLLCFSAARSYRDAQFSETATPSESFPRRRLSSVLDFTPSFIQPILDELKTRKKLFKDTPPEEVKYWFEYTGPLQKYYYRYSKSRGKADSFEGRDDSGVTSARYIDKAGGGADFESFFAQQYEDREAPFRTRLMDNCLSMGAATRPTMKGSFWSEWFGSEEGVLERCRVLFVMNTVGAGVGTTILWETHPPMAHGSGPKPWQSEQASAAMHMERNLREINAMCATGQVAARVQVLVCEPIPGVWTDWMDSLLVNCGGKAAPFEDVDGETSPYEGGVDVEERASPVQVVVVGSPKTADTCHDLKSGFMEQRMQDLVLAPPYLGEKKEEGTVRGNEKFDPNVKTTHPDLISSDDHDVYVAFKWSSLITTRTVSGFLQASADLSAGAGSPNTPTLDGKNLSPFLIPSFVRVSYVSEENNKVAKWRMHGDFFHPSAWEICNESYDMTWIPDTLSGNGGVSGVCYQDETKDRQRTSQKDCGQWWLYMVEEQMPTEPEIYASESVAPLVHGGSNFIWMLTERQRKEIVLQKVCKSSGDKCGEDPQAVIPLGDMESFMVNFMPNTALGKKHLEGRRPGYSQAKKLEDDREKVKERKQLKGQEDIEKALFDYTVYPVALMHKDATIKAARQQDSILSGEKHLGPRMLKSSYYDVTITKPRDPTLSWCQHLARRGMCALYADYLREGKDDTCREACGMTKFWTRIQEKEL